MTHFVDVRAEPPLSDADFWAPIVEAELPYYYAWYRLNEIAGTLAASPRAHVLSWCRTMGDRLLELNPLVAHLRNEDLVEASRVLDALGAVIDRGPETYRQVTEDPSSWDPEWVVDSSWAVLDIGTKALQKQTGQWVQVRSLWSEQRQDITKTPQDHEWIRLR